MACDFPGCREVDHAGRWCKRHKRQRRTAQNEIHLLRIQTDPPSVAHWRFATISTVEGVGARLVYATDPARRRVEAQSHCPVAVGHHVLGVVRPTVEAAVQWSVDWSLAEEQGDVRDEEQALALRQGWYRLDYPSALRAGLQGFLAARKTVNSAALPLPALATQIENELGAEMVGTTLHRQLSDMQVYVDELLSKLGSA